MADMLEALHFILKLLTIFQRTHKEAPKVMTPNQQNLYISLLAVPLDFIPRPLAA